MAIIDERTFKNPMILVGDPPEIPPGVIAPPPLQEFLAPFWVAELGATPIPGDGCPEMQRRAKEEDVLNSFMVPQFQVDVGVGGSDSSAVVDRALVGVGAFKDKVRGLPFGVTIQSTSAMITSPYHSFDPKCVRNGIFGIPNIGGNSCIYKWRMEPENFDGDTILKICRQNADGSIAIAAVPRHMTDYVTARLDVVDLEKKDDGSIEFPGSTMNLKDGKNDQVNAFTLFVKVLPGAIDKLPLVDPDPNVPTQANPPPWNLRISFGEVFINFWENNPQPTINLGKRVGIPLEIPARAVAQNSTELGSHPLALTIIPVWNGLLFSDSHPSSPTWGEKILYVQRNPDLAASDVINAILDAKAKDKPPRYGANGEFLPTADYDVEVDGKKQKKKKPWIVFPAIEDTAVNMGDTMRVAFTKCGGSLRFVPVFFSPFLRTHYLLLGSPEPSLVLDPKNLTSTTPKPGAPGVDNDQLPCLGGRWDSADPPFPFKEVPRVKMMPVTYYFGDGLKYNQGSGRLYQVRKGLKRVDMATFHVERETKQYRRPLQYWGFILYGTEKQSDYFNGFKNGDGALTFFDVPYHRIRNVQINRSLDGTNGTIVWDRYDSAIGLFFRPFQRIGGVQLAVIGGVDTVPGVIFTGIGMGNQETDTRDSNHITIPLRGKEVKMTSSDGGLTLMNAPYFDAWDHRIAIKYCTDYAGVPYVSFAKPYKLVSGSLEHHVIDFKSGTYVWDAIQDLLKRSTTIGYFDRFGVLKQYDRAAVTGVNWFYHSARLVSYDDRPDFANMYDVVAVAAIVRAGNIDPVKEFTQGRYVQTQPIIVPMRANTFPEFPWDKQAFYVINGIVTMRHLAAQAQRILFGFTRCRAAGSVSIPGNAQMELLDTFNTLWGITQITHSIDTQQKTFTTQLGLEWRVGSPDDVPADIINDLKKGGNQPPAEGDGVAAAAAGGEAVPPVVASAPESGSLNSGGTSVAYNSDAGFPTDVGSVTMPGDPGIDPDFNPGSSVTV